MKTKMGRPTDNPKSYRESFRLSEEDMNKIDYCINELNLNKTDIIRLGIDEVYKKVKEEKYEQIF